MMKDPSLSGAQIRAARTLLNWTAEALVQQSTLGFNTIRRMEATDDRTSLTAANEIAIRRALEAAGVEFIGENGGGPRGRSSKADIKAESMTATTVIP